eukprot:TRINITY_DN593_c0_g3_i1.p1 TRINITY_DN593_c0_g3~~TRINITY_DN593_c0_g3_i1.p1  ORF type:complete len:439 (+),score=57.35 TRINITY_DN593_c0_g3_i1:188-1318(+)
MMKNSIKKETKPIISQLADADIRSIMVTGDNGFTAIAVAKECGIIRPESKVYLGDLKVTNGIKSITWTLPAHSNVELKPPPKAKTEPPLYGSISNDLGCGRESRGRKYDMALLILCENEPWDEREDYTLAFTGKAWDYLITEDPKCYSDQLRKYLRKTAVFARMSPESKASLVEALQSTGLSVGMCGDGANDCVALKTADVGISLSDTEASVAAPFTSKVPDISCVIMLLKEGRAALTTTFQCFKYVALYSMIQFVSVTLMYSLDRNMADLQFIMMDLIMLVPLPFTMNYTEAANKLSKQLPNSNLLSFPVLCSIVGQALIQASVQASFRLTLGFTFLLCQVNGLVRASSFGRGRQHTGKQKQPMPRKHSNEPITT